MTYSVNQTIEAFQHVLMCVPKYIDKRGLAAWEKSFARRQKYLREHIKTAVRTRGGDYEGAPIEGHALTLHGITVSVKNGYEQLIRAWLVEADANKAGA